MGFNYFKNFSRELASDTHFCDIIGGVYGDTHKGVC